MKPEEFLMLLDNPAVEACFKTYLLSSFILCWIPYCHLLWRKLSSYQPSEDKVDALAATIVTLHRDLEARNARIMQLDDENTIV